MSERKAKSTIAYDALAAVGMCALAYGCWLAWAPLGFIVPGALMIVGALVGAKR